jgi:hypothetical protein
MPRESGAFFMPAFSIPDFSGKTGRREWLDGLLEGRDDKLVRQPSGAGSTGVDRRTTKRICDLGP